MRRLVGVCWYVCSSLHYCFPGLFGRVLLLLGGERHLGGCICVRISWSLARISVRTVAFFALVRLFAAWLLALVSLVPQHVFLRVWLSFSSW